MQHAGRAFAQELPEAAPPQTRMLVERSPEERDPLPCTARRSKEGAMAQQKGQATVSKQSLQNRRHTQTDRRARVADTGRTAQAGAAGAQRHGRPASTSTRAHTEARTDGMTNRTVGLRANLVGL